MYLSSVPDSLRTGRPVIVGNIDSQSYPDIPRNGLHPRHCSQYLHVDIPTMVQI